MKNLKCILLVSFLITAFCASCTKADLAKNNSPLDSTAVMGFADSTLLIKSLHMTMYDTAMENITDTLSYNYFYDTLDKKVQIFLHVPLGAADPDYFGILRYDASGRIVSIEVNPVYFSFPEDLSKREYVYDDQQVIKTIHTTYNDHVEDIGIIKSGAGTGYALDWRIANDLKDTIQNHVQFDGKGRISNYSSRSIASPAGEGYLDTLIYDADDNIIKQIETHLDYQYDTSTYDLYTYTRDTKGNQFYNFVQVLYHGIANLPLGIGDQFSDPYNYLNQQTKYPATQTIVYHLDDLGNPYFVTLSSPNQFDSKNRLIQTTLFADDAQVYPVIMTLSYYK